MPEYAFDVKLSAVVRIKADNLYDARRGLADSLDAATPGNGQCGENTRITEVSLTEGQYEVLDCLEPFETLLETIVEDLP